MHFLVTFRYLQFSFVVNYFVVDQVLTKILQIDPKLTFNVFHILSHVRISKIEKIFDGTTPPKKKAFFGGVYGLKGKGFRVCLGPINISA